MPPIDMTIDVQLHHAGGPEITDSAHLADWIVNGGTLEMRDEQTRENTLFFWACPQHPAAEECDCLNEDITSLYRIEISSAG